MFFKGLLGIDILATLVFCYFFYAGLADGSISEFNSHIWIKLSFAIVAILGGGILFRILRKTVLANIVLSLMAAPAVFFCLFIVLFALSGSEWR